LDWDTIPHPKFFIIKIYIYIYIVHLLKK
jgi:hypothetical protein